MRLFVAVIDNNWIAFHASRVWTVDFAKQSWAAEKVRTLYGTLTHYKATSAMLVTTASFSKLAHAMAADNKFRLPHRGFADLVVWREEYGTHRR